MVVILHIPICYVSFISWYLLTSSFFTSCVKINSFLYRVYVYCVYMPVGTWAPKPGGGQKCQISLRLELQAAGGYLCALRTQSGTSERAASAPNWGAISPPPIHPNSLRIGSILSTCPPSSVSLIENFMHSYSVPWSNQCRDKILLHSDPPPSCLRALFLKKILSFLPWFYFVSLLCWSLSQHEDGIFYSLYILFTVPFLVTLSQNPSPISPSSLY